MCVCFLWFFFVKPNYQIKEISLEVPVDYIVFKTEDEDLLIVHDINSKGGDQIL